jgi:hypothetical protein
VTRERDGLPFELNTPGPTTVVDVGFPMVFRFQVVIVGAPSSSRPDNLATSEGQGVFWFRITGKSVWAVAGPGYDLAPFHVS